MIIKGFERAETTIAKLAREVGWRGYWVTIEAKVLWRSMVRLWKSLTARGKVWSTGGAMCSKVRLSSRSPPKMSKFLSKFPSKFPSKFRKPSIA